MARRVLFDSRPIALGNCLTATLSALIPENEHKLQPFSAQLEKPVKDFEDRCALLGLPISLWSSAPNNTTKVIANPLQAVMSELDNRYCEQRRKTILSRARECLLSDYHNTMFGTGDCLEDDIASAGSIGDLRAMMEQSGASAMQALSFECCQVSLSVCFSMAV